MFGVGLIAAHVSGLSLAVRLEARVRRSLVLALDQQTTPLQLLCGRGAIHLIGATPTRARVEVAKGSIERRLKALPAFMSFIRSF